MLILYHEKYLLNKFILLHKLLTKSNNKTEKHQDQNNYDNYEGNEECKTIIQHEKT